MEEKEIERVVRQVLSEEVSEHRAFLGQQFKQITWGVGVLFTIAAASFVFLLGRSFDEAELRVVQTIDEKVFEYRIAEDLKRKVNEHVAIAMANNVDSDSTISQIDTLVKNKAEIVTKNLKDDIQKSISIVVNRQIQDKQNLNAEELIRKYVIPSGAVMAFNQNSCPFGWLEYKAAYGRFIRGIDKSGEK